MKKIGITKEILKSIKPKTVLYAEFAEGGAMGAVGTARIFTLEDDKLIFYLVEDIFNNKENEEIWGEVRLMLDSLVEKGVLVYAYAGFGNHAYKAVKAEFMRDDDESSFIYKTADKTYKIPASCKGAYDSTVAKFAEREMSLEELGEYFDKNWRKMNGGECWFFHNYLEQSKLNDSGRAWFDFTVLDYLNAVGCLQHLHGENYILNNDSLSECWKALFKYRLRDVTEKIGWNKLNKLFVQMVQAGKVDLFSRIEKLIHEPVEAIYDTLPVIKSEQVGLRVFDADSLEKLFDRPMLVEFSKATHAKIIKDIMGRSGSSFNPDAKGIAYYLANYLLNEDKLPFSDVLPAVAHIVEVLPNDDFNHTHTDQLFWVCGEILDKAWRYLEEDEAIQKKYRGMMYNLYWPRVGSLWPVLHRDEFEFKAEAQSKIFEDSLNFVMSLSDIAERNGEIKAFLDVNAERIGYNAGVLGKAAFMHTLKGLKPKDEFDRILEVVEPKDYHMFLSYPNGIEEAEILMDELFRTDVKARITGMARLQVLESLLITPNTMGVGEYILNYIDKKFDEFVALVSTEAVGFNVEPTLALEDLFVAMSKGITEENEFPAYKSIESKLLELKNDIKCNPEKLADAMKYARKHRRTILFQRSDLQKLF